MNLVFEKLTQTLAASAAWDLRIAADYFRVSAASYPITVKLFKDNRELGSMSGVEAGEYVSGVPFDRVRIENGGNSQNITVQLAGGGVGSDRVLGEVSVIDGGKARTLGGSAFMGAGFQGAIAAQFAAVQLWNPTAGTNLIVSRVAVVSSTSQQTTLKAGSSALTTLHSTPRAKKIDGAASSAALRVATSVGPFGTSPHYLFHGVVANQCFVYTFTEPLVVPPGKGLLVQAENVNTDLSASYEFIEEAA